MSQYEVMVVAELLTGKGYELVTIGESDFTDHTMRKYFSAVSALAKAGKNYDLVSVFESDTENFSLTAMTQITQDAVYFDMERACRQIRLASQKRRVIGQAAKLIELCQSPSADADELLTACDLVVTEAANETATTRTRHISKFLGETFDQIESRSRAPEGVTTGIGCLDRRMTSMRAGNLVIIAARPAVGKTGIALNIALHIAKNFGPIFIVSAEMTAAELGERVLSTHSGVGYGSIRSGDLKPEDYDLMLPAVAQLKKLPVYVDDTATPTVSSVCAEAHKLNRKEKLSAVFVDYLTLLQGEGDTRALEVGFISRRLKRLAKELKCPVIALAQLNRAAVGGKPNLSHLRDSGEIEQDADVVIFLHKDQDTQTNIETIFAKGRGFPIGTEWLKWDGAHMQFTEGEDQTDNTDRKQGRSYAHKYRDGK